MRGVARVMISARDFKYDRTETAGTLDLVGVALAVASNRICLVFGDKF